MKKISLILFVIAVLIIIAAFIADKPQAPKDLTQNINYYISHGVAQNIGVYVYDLNTKKHYGINENQAFVPASLLKVPLMMDYLKQAEDNQSIFSLTAPLTQDVINKTAKSKFIYPEITDKMVLGQTYTLGELLVRLIKYSDNNAAGTLENFIPEEKLISTISELTEAHFKPGAMLSPKQYSNVFIKLANADYLSKDMSANAIDLLTDINFNTGLVAGVPKEVKVAHKFGILATEDLMQYGLNDCGIVYTTSPYVICVMTTGSNIQQLEGVISGISKVVYEHQK